jgi:ElaB/YqjD/DUF883 family membrane-anchored ribosome-binding protein
MSTKKPAEEATVAELRSDIAETRAELGDTVEALAAKADVKERAKETVRETAAAARASGQQAVDRVEDSVRRRPVSWGAVLAGGIAAVVAISVLTRRRSQRA